LRIVFVGQAELNFPLTIAPYFNSQAPYISTGRPNSSLQEQGKRSVDPFVRDSIPNSICSIRQMRRMAPALIHFSARRTSLISTLFIGSKSGCFGVLEPMSQSPPANLLAFCSSQQGIHDCDRRPKSSTHWDHGAAKLLACATPYSVKLPVPS
jgi:hypothetical protein